MTPKKSAKHELYDDEPKTKEIAPEPKIKSWNYKTMVLTCRNQSDLEAAEIELNKLGAQGWELISAFVVSETYQVYHFKLGGPEVKV